MRNSDIFDSYTKIALETGLVSKTTSEDLKKKLEENPRMDSLDISAIEALYGVKPDMPKDMKYKNNIIENAHPNSVIVAPSYDKLNGLVENLIERQTILINIVNKTPDGHITQRKYADNNMLLALVRVANDLDNTGKSELCKLADVCLEQVSNNIKKDFKKVAIEPLTTTLLVGIPALIGALYLQQHMKFINEGYTKNHEKLIAEIDDMLESSTSIQTQVGAGQEYVGKFITQMRDFRNKLMNFYNIYNRVVPILDYIEQPRTAEKLVILARNPQSQTICKAYDLLKTHIDNMLPYLQSIETNFSNETYKLRQVAEKGWMQKLVDWTQVLHGGMGLIADDFDDVRRAIMPYKKSISDIIKIFEKSDAVQSDAKNKLDRAAIESEKEFGNQYAAPANPAKTQVEDDLGVGNLERDLGDVLKI